MSKSITCPKCNRELYLENDDDILSNCPHCGASLDARQDLGTPLSVTILRILVPAVLVILFFPLYKRLLGGAVDVMILLLLIAFFWIAWDFVSRVNGAAIDCVMEALAERGVAPTSPSYRNVMAFIMKMLCYGTGFLLLFLEMLIVVIWAKKEKRIAVGHKRAETSGFLSTSS